MYVSGLIKSHSLFVSEPLGGVRDLQVTDPTSSTLNVRWEHADGNPRNYKVFYVPQPGDEEKMVRHSLLTLSMKI